MKTMSNNTKTRLFMLLAAFSSFLFPQATQAMVSLTPAADKAPTIIVKDNHSKAVIYKRNGVYYYGYGSSPQKIVTNGEIRPREIIVKYKSDSTVATAATNGSITATAKENKGILTSVNNPLHIAMVKLTEDKNYFQTLQALKTNPDVEYAEPNYVLHAQSRPNDTRYSEQWGPAMTQAEPAWDKVDPAKRASVTIAVLDTGINKNHEDLQNSIVPGYDFVNNDNDPTDGQGHGTHVSGIAAALSNNAKGVAGVAGGSKIMPVKVLDDNGSGDINTIINGIKYAADHGAKVISMSLGGPGTSQAMQEAVNYALNRGVNVVAASGNDNGAVNLPGNCNGVITVGAIDSTGNRASYSNYGRELDVTAPGSQILSTYIGGTSAYTYLSGTSMATPFVSGVVALVRAANPNLSATAVNTLIQQAVTDKGAAGFDNYYGFGLINVNKAVDLALNNTAPAPTPTPVPQPTPVPTPAPEPQPQTDTNLALSKKVVASTIEGSTRTAAKAVDGNVATRWASAEKIDPQWIYVDLGKVSTIHKLILRWETAYAKSYKIQISNDGSNWVNVYSTTNGSGGTTTLSGSVTGRFVRLLGTQRGTPYGYSLWEFEVYGI